MRNRLKETLDPIGPPEVDYVVKVGVLAVIGYILFRLGLPIVVFVIFCIIIMLSSTQNGRIPFFN
jgi:hypothetical protein